MRRALLALLTAALLTTAGCSGAFGGDPAGTDVTTTTPSDATGTATDSLPPGVTTDGLAEPDVLVRAHADALADRSVTFHEREVRRYGNGTLASRQDLTVRTAANRTRFVATADRTNRPVYGASEGRVVTFGDGTGIYRKVETANSSWTTVLRGPNGDPRDPEFLGLHAARSDDIYILLNAFALNDSSDVRRLTEDPDRYRLQSAELARTNLLASLLELATVRNASLNLVATSEGRVESYRLEYAGTKQGREVRGTTTLEYSSVGETEVETPSWYDRVKERVEATETTEVNATTETTE